MYLYKFSYYIVMSSMYLVNVKRSLTWSAEFDFTAWHKYLFFSRLYVGVKLKLRR